MLKSFGSTWASTSKFVWELLGYREIRIIMAGRPSGGKTTILYQMKLNEVVRTIPTRGFNVETIEYMNTSFTMWDMGSSVGTRPLRKHYLRNTQALLYVVDSASPESIQETFKELQDDLNEPELRDALLLIYANKQDLPGAMSTDKVADLLGLAALKDREWGIQATSAINGDGLFEGLAWFAAKGREKKGLSLRSP